MTLAEVANEFKWPKLTRATIYHENGAIPGVYVILHKDSNSKRYVVYYVVFLKILEMLGTSTYKENIL